MENWMDVLKGYKGEDIRNVGYQLLGDLVAYRGRTSHEDADVSQVVNFTLAVAANAIAAYKANPEAIDGPITEQMLRRIIPD